MTEASCKNVIWNPPTSWSVERVRPLPSQQPASSNPPAAASQPSQPSQPASLASQPSQSAIAASGHRGLRPPGLDVSNRFSRGIHSGSGRFHRPASGGSGGQTFWHRQHQGGQPNMPQTLQISMTWPPFQQIESWDVSGTTISRIQSTHPNSIGSGMPFH